MLENTFETIIKGSNTVFLDIPQNEYFYAYGSVNKYSAEKAVRDYFIMKGKKGIPYVQDISVDAYTNNIIIILKVYSSSGISNKTYIS